MFEWDADKAAGNFRKHGVRFEFAVAVFDDPRRIESDVSRAQDGELRSKTVGRIGNKLFAVVFTMRGAVRRIISARRTSAAEDKRYADHSQNQG